MKWKWTKKEKIFLSITTVIIIGYMAGAILIDHGRMWPLATALAATAIASITIFVMAMNKRAEK